MGIPVRVSFLADCYLSFHWVVNKFCKTNSGPLWCVYFGPIGVVCRTVTNYETYTSLRSKFLWECVSFVLLSICPVAVLLNRTANKGDDQQMFLVNGAESQANQRNWLKMAVLVQHGAHAQRHRSSLSMQVFPDLHLTSNLELKSESCALQGSVNNVFNDLKYTTS